MLLSFINFHSEAVLDIREGLEGCSIDMALVRPDGADRVVPD